MHHTHLSGWLPAFQPASTSNLTPTSQDAPGSQKVLRNTPSQHKTLEQKHPFLTQVSQLCALENSEK